MKTYNLPSTKSTSGGSCSSLPAVYDAITVRVQGRDGEKCSIFAFFFFEIYICMCVCTCKESQVGGFRSDYKVEILSLQSACQIVLDARQNWSSGLTLFMRPR